MAVKTYSLSKDGKKYCSEHTKVLEMASTSASTVYSDTVLVDTDLMLKIEQLFKKLNCSKYIISSGYRTAAHDKAVGGNGKGQHTLGKAVDACFYDKNGKVIPAQIVCCVAQDLGFPGIANISRNYRYVHLDTRSSGKYRGDETVSYNTVTSDFYSYFKISKAEVEKYTGKAETTTAKPATRKQGDTVKLTNALRYASSSGKALSRRITGTYYLYDGKKINGRYRVTVRKDYCGKKPAALHTTCWVSETDCV